MKPADQPGARRWGGPDFFDLPVVHSVQGDKPVMVTAWELTAEEVEQVQRHGRIWLGIMGTVHPPIWLSTSKPFELGDDAAR
jgi:hypothetical protein